MHNAFLQLRAVKPLERITVKELCELAEISKATFYLHYKDIYDCSEHLQQEVISTICSNITYTEQITTSLTSVTEELYHSFMAQQTLIDILFSGNQKSVLPQSIEKELRLHIFKNAPQLQNDVSFNIMLTYSIQGGFYAFMENSKKYGDDVAINELLKIQEIFSNANK